MLSEDIQNAITAFPLVSLAGKTERNLRAPPPFSGAIEGSRCLEAYRKIDRQALSRFRTSSHGLRPAGQVTINTLAVALCHTISDSKQWALPLRGQGWLLLRSPEGPASVHLELDCCPATSGFKKKKRGTSELQTLPGVTRS